MSIARWIQAACAVVGLLLAPAAIAQIDDHGDTCGGGTSILADSSLVPGTIDPVSDPDWFSFPAALNREYRVELVGASQSFYPRVEAFEGNCATLIADSSVNNFPLTVISLAAQTINLKVTSGSNTAGTFTIRVVDVGPVVDDHGNTPSTATPILADASVNPGVINYTGDLDYFQITLVGGHEYAFNLRCEGAYFSTIQGLLQNSSNIGLASAYDYNFATTGFDATPSTSVFYCPIGAGGTYTFKVQSQQTGVAYSLWVTDSGDIGSIDDHQNTCSLGTLFPPDSSLQSSIIEPNTEEDWCNFPALANHEYRVELIGTTQSYYPRIQVYEGDCATLIGDSSTSNFPITVLSFSSQTVRLRITSAYGNAGHAYFRVVDVGPLVDDHGNTPSTATPILADDSVNPGVINYTGDLDYFKINLVGGHEYAFNLRCEGAYFSTVQGLLQNSSNIGLASAYDYNFATTGFDPTPSTSVFYCPIGADGAYTFKVQSQQVGVPYSLWVTDSGDIGSVDDHGDACGSGTPILPDSSQTSTVIEPGADEDHFDFPAAANREYRIELLGTTQSYYPRIQAFEGDCSTLMADSSTSNFPLTVISSAAQSINIKVTSAYGNAGHAYFRVVDVGPVVDDYSNSFSGSSILATNGLVLSGVVNYTGDVDVFKLNLSGGREYYMNLRCEGAYFQTVQGTLLTGANSGLASAYDYNFATTGFDLSPSIAVWYCPVTQDGVYYFKVQSQQSNVPYSLWITGGCSGDMDGSGTTDFGDFLAFFNAYDNLDPSADIDLSGEVDFADFLSFFNSYDTGC
jgi:hypothetical protein